MIMNDDFSFMNEQQLDENKKHSLNDEDRDRMQMVKIVYGPMPDSLVEPSLIKKYPQLLHPFMYMAIRFIVAVLTVFA
jgi:hypothetical protein